MADKYNVAGQTALGNTNTWAATQHGAGGDGAPGTSDTVFILNGSDALTGNIDTDLDNVTIGGQFSGSIGSSGSPTIIGCDGDVLIEGMKIGAIYLGASTTHDVASITINAPNSDVYLTEASGGDFTRVIVKACNSLTIEGIVLNLQYLGGHVEPIAHNGTAIAGLTQIGGRLECGRAITTADVDRGSLVVKQIDTSETAPAVGTVNVSGKATYNHRSSGTVTAANIYDGTYTPAGADVGHTVTTLNRYGGPGVSRFVKNAGPVSVTVGTDNNYGGSGDLTQDTLGGIPNSI